MSNLQEDGEKLIKGLSYVRDEFLRTRELLSISIRKDIVAVELKDIIANNKTYDSLKVKLEEYIESLYKDYNASKKEDNKDVEEPGEQN